MRQMHKTQDKHKTDTRQKQDRHKTNTRQTQDKHKRRPHQVKASKAAHEAFDVVGSPEDGLPPPRLLLDLGLDA